MVKKIQKYFIIILVLVIPTMFVAYYFLFYKYIDKGDYFPNMLEIGRRALFNAQFAFGNAKSTDLNEIVTLYKIQTYVLKFDFIKYTQIYSSSELYEILSIRDALVSLNFYAKMINEGQQGDAKNLLDIVIESGRHCDEVERRFSQLRSNWSTILARYKGVSHPLPPLPPDDETINLPGLPMFIRVKTGEYMIGTPADEGGRDKNYEPKPYIYKTNGFWISQTEITQKNWYYFMPGNNVTNSPVTKITIMDVDNYCAILNAKYTQYKFSLPNEAEWEIACRAGMDPSKGPINAPGHQDWFQGSKETAEQKLQQYAWFKKNLNSNCLPQEVATLKPNAWNIFDMHGNVSELCTRIPGDTGLYKSHLTQVPIRGGSFLSEYNRCRAGSRSFEKADTKLASIGFRLVMRNK